MSFAEMQENPCVVVASDPTPKMSSQIWTGAESIKNGSARKSDKTTVAATANVIALLTSQLYTFRSKGERKKSNGFYFCSHPFIVEKVTRLICISDAHFRYNVVWLLKSTPNCIMHLKLYWCFCFCSGHCCWS